MSVGSPQPGVRRIGLNLECNCTVDTQSAHAAGQTNRGGAAENSDGRGGTMEKARLQ